MAIQREDIKLPRGYSESKKREIAKAIISWIQDRSFRGLDKENRPFKKYNPEYAKEKGVGVKEVDLVLSGDMLDALQLLEVYGDYVSIGYRRGKQNDKAEGNITGSYGQPSPNPDKARDFLGISRRDLAMIIDSFPQDDAELADRDLLDQLEQEWDSLTPAQRKELLKQIQEE